MEDELLLHNGTVVTEEDEQMADESQEHVLEHKMSVDVWKWIAASLFALLMFMIGGYVSAQRSDSRIDRHEELVGHPIMDVRVTNLEEKIDEELTEIKEAIKEINAKLDN